MATTLEKPQVQDVQRLVLYEVSWGSYEKLLDALGDRPGLRSTYDRGTLELMTKSGLHERWKKWLGQMIELMCWELQIPKASGGSFTYRREKAEKGLEPDECYWIQHEADVRGKIEIDFAQDPPPDLAIEIEVTRSALDRLGIYAALGIPELWCFDGQSLRVYHLRDDGRYEQAEESRAFPFLRITELPRFLKLDDPGDEQTRLREFVDWMRGQVRHGHQAPDA